MKKTLIRLDDDIYEELVRMSVKKYGNTKHISDVINELLRKRLTRREKKRVRMSITISLEKAEKLTPKEIDRLAEEELSGSRY
ncbi:MAG: hypothetical protein QW743_08420 [Candidatus Methanomethylicia archaeon]